MILSFDKYCDTAIFRSHTRPYLQRIVTRNTVTHFCMSNAYAKSPSSNFQFEFSRFLRGVIDVHCTVSMCNFLSRNSERDLLVDKRRESGKNKVACRDMYSVWLGWLAKCCTRHPISEPKDKTFRWQIRRKMVAKLAQLKRNCGWNTGCGRYVQPVDSRHSRANCTYFLHNRGKIPTQLPVYASFPFTFPLFSFFLFFFCFVFLSTKARGSVWRISRAQMKLRAGEKEIKVNRMCTFRSKKEAFLLEYSNCRNSTSEKGKSLWMGRNVCFLTVRKFIFDANKIKVNWTVNCWSSNRCQPRPNRNDRNFPEEILLWHRGPC